MRQKDKMKVSKGKLKGEVTAYLEARSFRDDRLWSIRQGKMWTSVNGLEMTKDEFDQKFPVPNVIKFYRSVDNPDKTKFYLT